MKTKRLLMLSLALNGLLAITALITLRFSNGDPARPSGQRAPHGDVAFANPDSSGAADDVSMEPPPAGNLAATAAVHSPARSGGPAWAPAPPPATVLTTGRAKFANPSAIRPPGSVAVGGNPVAASSAGQSQRGERPNAAQAPGLTTARIAPAGAAGVPPSADSPSPAGPVDDQSVPAAQDSAGSPATAPQSAPPVSAEPTGADRSPPASSETEITVPDGGVKVPAVLEDSSALNLSDTEQSAWESLQHEFAAAISRGSRDPTDPVYQKLWEVAQTMSDQRFKALFGHEAYLIQQVQANLQRAAASQ